MYWQNEEAKQPKVSFRDLFCETIKPYETMKTKYDKIKPSKGNFVFHLTRHGWERFGTITEVESNGIVHVKKDGGETDTFIWIFQAGTKNEHTNSLFKWGRSRFDKPELP